MVQAASLPCRAQNERGCTERCHLHSPLLARTHAATCRCIPNPLTRARRPARPYAQVDDAHLTRPSPHCFRVWQAEEAVASLPLRVAVRVHCGHQACAQHDGHTPGYSSGTKLRVPY